MDAGHGMGFVNICNMTIHYKRTLGSIEYHLDKNLDVIDQKLFELHQKRLALIEERNRGVRIKRAMRLGFKPNENLDRIRKELNEKIISIVKENRPTHQEVADMAMIPRTRVTAIMNRHLERVSIDCMVKILDLFGISTTIHLS
ncbi:MAG: XRE family transcriptional regulator [Bdellovibrionota bacterium]